MPQGSRQGLGFAHAGVPSSATAAAKATTTTRYADDHELCYNLGVQLGERVPYVIVNRHDGDLRLRNSAQRPEVLLFARRDAT